MRSRTRTEGNHGKGPCQTWRASNEAKTINLDWNEKKRAVRLIVNQDRVRQLGLSSKALSQMLYTVFNGAPVAEIRGSIYLVDVVARANASERLSLDTLRNIQVSLPAARWPGHNRTPEIRPSNWSP